MSSKKRGFTLLEMLLVIAIIAILAAIVIVAINPARQLAQARNAQRASDLNAIYKAVQQYYIDNGDWPPEAAPFIPDELTDICYTGGGESNGCVTLDDALVPTYLPALPQNPSSENYKIALNAGTKKLAMTAPGSRKAGLVGIVLGTSTDMVLLDEKDGGGSGEDEPIEISFVGSYDTSGQLLDVSVSGDYAFLGIYGEDVKVLSISDPSNPVLTGSANLYANDINGIHNVENYVYSSDNESGLKIIDVSTPASPSVVGAYYDLGSAEDVFVSGDYAYVSNWSSVATIDISIPSTPSLAAEYNGVNTAYSIVVSGNYAYVADGASGLQIIDISTPASPALVGTYNTSGTAYGVAVSGNYAYVTDGASGLQIIDISTPASPALVGTYNTSGTAYGVAVSGNYAYVADGASGLHVIDISTKSSPELVDSYNDSSTAYAVTVSDGYIYVSNGYNGLLVLEI